MKSEQRIFKNEQQKAKDHKDEVFVDWLVVKILILLILCILYSIFN
jgi:hypothetical protein